MNLHMKIHSLRPLPENFSLQRETVYLTISTLIGLTMGLIAKAADNVPIIGILGTEIGIWIFAAVIIAVYSHYPLAAGLNVMFFFLAMLVSYYVYGYFVLGFFPFYYFLKWFIISLLSFFTGIIMWFAKAKGLFGIIISAVPIALLFAHGYPVYYTYKIHLGISVLFGLILNWLLPRTLKMKALTLIISILFMIIFINLNTILYI